MAQGEDRKRVETYRTVLRTHAEKRWDALECEKGTHAPEQSEARLAVP